MKCVLLSVRPQWVVKILNKEKTIEVRKHFPKDYVGWVYIYCCKQRKNEIGCHINYEKVDGKVIARFWCDRVDEFYDFDDGLCKQACLDRGKMLDYLGNKNGYAIHITKLEIFDKPKDISEFRQWRDCGKCWHEEDCDCNLEACFMTGGKLTRAPQSFMFIEV